MSGSQWKGLTVKVRCDNVAVVATVNWSTSHDSETMYLFIICYLQNFCSTSTCHTCQALITHWQTTYCASHFLSSHIQANHYPTHILEEILDILITSKPPDVTSLYQIVNQYFQQGLAPATQCTYQSTKKLYLNFC